MATQTVAEFCREFCDEEFDIGDEECFAECIGDE